MSKIYLKFCAICSSKTINLLIVHYNYDEQPIKFIKPQIIYRFRIS